MHLVQGCHAIIQRAIDSLHCTDADLIQELWTVALQLAYQHDPSNGPFDEYLLPRLRIAIARYHKQKHSLLSLDETDRHGRPLASFLAETDDRRRPHTDSTIAEAIDAALAVMPAQLRDICERLKHYSIAEVARQLGVSHHVIRRAVRQARPYFVRSLYGDSAMTALQSEPLQVYQDRSKDYLTSHQLADFRRCPLLYHKKKLGLIEEAETPAYLVGRALHTLVLEGVDKFRDEYAVGGPINPKTGQPYGNNTKAFAQWAADQGKPVLTNSQYDLLVQMALAVEKHALSQSLLADGIPEGVARAEYCNVPCQARIDWFNPKHGIIDLKTCDDLDWFEADARRYGYIHQMAFYQAILFCHTKVTHPVHLIAVEKKEPFRCGVWKVAQEALDYARIENEDAIRRLKHCQETNQWPTGYEECRVFDRV